ncbi:hypothetical protein [Arthrobacter oryzae]|uniref:Tight adherence protein B n=1 Tax=Arthrobacter oryzae TaxID=409290 RepID=A0A495EW51_9MICC|nr:hypothetical protein [Arthrobacter oryzae]RKR20863.1 tight adherence protein B [Arthrobacter oryzae]
MTGPLVVVLGLVLVPALWLALAAPGAAARRARRALTGASLRSSAAGEERRPRPLRAVREAFPGAGRWFGGGPSEAVPMTVVVQQLAALLKGGRSPARLWDELWILYGGAARREGSAVNRAAHGRDRDGTGEVSGPVLDPGSLRILAAARGAALRGSSVAEAIRREVSGEAAGGGSDGTAAKAAGRVRLGRDRRVWGELGACFDTAEASGCPLADVLTRFAAHLETEDDAEAARQTALAGPRATVRLLTWLPLSGLGLGLLLGVDPAATLVQNPWGLAALAAGAALTAAGRLWSSGLVRAAAGDPT